MWREKFKLVLDHLTAELITFLGVSIVVVIKGLRKRFQAANALEATINKEDSMEKEVVIGTEGKVGVKLENGKLYLVANYDGVQADANLAIGLEVDMFIDALAEKIPGKIDDTVLNLLKAVLKIV